jgi:Sulfotransferase family
MTQAPPRLDFVLGLPRSGSTWLGRALGRHPDVAVFGETCFYGRLHVSPRPDGWYGAEELERVRRIQRTRDWETTTSDPTGGNPPWRPGEYAALVDAAVGGLQPPVRPRDVLAAIAAAVAVRESKQRVIEKTPQHVHWLPRVAASFPDARFVLTVRDPYEYMASYQRLGRRLDGRARRALDLSWRHPLIAALFWRSYSTSIELALANYPERTLLVRTEDLRDRPGEVLAGVQSFLELPEVDLFGTEGVNSSFREGERRALRGTDVFWMNLVAGRAMRRGGYESRKEKPGVAAAAVSIAIAPLSLAATAVRIPSMVPSLGGAVTGTSGAGSGVRRARAERHRVAPSRLGKALRTVTNGCRPRPSSPSPSASAPGRKRATRSWRCRWEWRGSPSS